MNQADFRANTPYASLGDVVAAAPEDARRTFIRKTYTHLAAAVYAFTLLIWFFMSIGLDQTVLNLIGNSGLAWLVVLGAFMIVSGVASSWAQSTTSIGKQYAGLFLYVIAEAVIFLPLLALAQDQTVTALGRQWSIIPAAGLTTAIMFAGLTAYVMFTKQDFSFIGGFLNISMFGALALIVVSALFGFNLGVWFAALMVMAACGYILYYTSNIVRVYRTDQYVAAALALFASVALLFWYIIQIFLANRD